MRKILSIFILIMILIPVSIFAEEDVLDVKIQKSVGAGETAVITSKSILNVKDKEGNNVKSLNTNTVKVSLTDGKIAFKNPVGKTIETDFDSTGENIITSSSNIKVGKITYRGGISFRINNDKIDIVNRVNIEDYLRGVVPKEIGSSANIEALKAQAVCSRSFAVSNKNKFIKYGYNLDDTTTSQVYGGVNAEKKQTDKAIKETEGLLVYYNDKVAQTIFGASSGGFVASAEDVWGGKDSPYLQSFTDPYSSEPWKFEINATELANKLRNSDSTISYIPDLYISNRDGSGRVKELISSSGATLTGAKLRSALGSTKFKSTLFYVEQVGDKFIFTGTGYGHGVGMSQKGAMKMAKEGFSFSEILTYYFRGVEIR